MTKRKQIDWFYLTLVLFMVSLPFSEALISVSGVLLFLVSLTQIEKETLRKQFRNGKPLILFSSIYLVYLIGFIFTKDIKWGIYDLRKDIPYLIIPWAFLFGKQISTKQLANLLKLFALSVFASAAITMIWFYLKNERTVLNAQEFGFIHHIRFSFEVVFAMIILSVLLLTNQFHLKRYGKIMIIVSIVFLFLFLIWNQSFTGLIAFLGTVFAGVLILVSKLQSKRLKTIVWIGMTILVLVPVLYLSYSIHKFYNIDKVDFNHLDQTTALGHKYTQHLKDKNIENGHYVGLYWCEPEMREAWNERAKVKYDSIGDNGYEVKYTLIRYLTSKNLRKDAAGVKQLSEEDIQNIEAGISNYILAEEGLSLYPRIYVSIWELDNYFKTGNANQQSISQRIEFVKAALTIINDHFWFGVGTGNWKEAYRKAYQKNKSQMDPARYGDAHNQYLNYMVKFGLVGLLWILFAIVYPVIKTESYRNPIFLLFLIMMLIANFGDSNFETHVGGSFFVLIYCLFISTKNWDFKLRKDLTN